MVFSFSRGRAADYGVMNGEKMKRLLLALIAMLLLLPVATVQAADAVPFKDFVSITEKVLDTLDEIETVFSDSESMKIEAKMAFKKFDIAMKKYDRYVKTWPEGKQGIIAWKMQSARLLYDMTLFEGLYGKSHEEAKIATQEARDMFAKYRKSQK
jgi:hypothetical protein